jgi:hypothetical protein
VQDTLPSPDGSGKSADAVIVSGGALEAKALPLTTAPPVTAAPAKVRAARAVN